MEPKFQTSFIPKKPIVAGQSTGFQVVKQTNIFNVIATILFLITILSAGALYLYKNLLVSQIADEGRQLVQATDAFQPDRIKELLDFNARLIVAKGLLSNHVVVSKFLHLVESDTIKNMRLNSLEYSVENNKPSIRMNAESKSYNALAQQANIFATSEFIKNPLFTNFQPLSNGDVSVNFTAILVPDLVSYQKAVESLSGTQANPPTQ